MHVMYHNVVFSIKKQKMLVKVSGKWKNLGKKSITLSADHKQYFNESYVE